MILIKDIDCIGTFDGEERILNHASILVDGRRIAAVGDFPTEGLAIDEVIDGRGKVAIPGFVNTHHHFFQQLTRAYPAVHSGSILEWLYRLYPLWGEMDEEAQYYATLLSCGEMLLTGCTTSADMAYLYPFGRTGMMDVEIQAAAEIGMRLHPSRASMPAMEGDLVGKLAAGGYPVENLVEDPDTILAECERVIHTYNDPGEFSMCRVCVGPTDKTYLNPGFMRDLATLARKHGASMHTHLHPRPDEIKLAKEKLNLEPIDFLDEVGWLGPDVWFAHATAFTPYYIEKVAKTGTGVSHSPSSNMRLSYGTAPIPALVAAGAKVSVGVDGGASNDSGDYLLELREVLLVHRIRNLHPDPHGSTNATTPYGVLSIGTRGGAAVLNRPDLGSIEVGKAADITLFDQQRLDFAGSHDPLAALLFCGMSHIADTVLVNGRVVVRKGHLALVDEAKIFEGASQAAARIVRTFGEKYPAMA